MRKSFVNLIIALLFSIIFCQNLKAASRSIDSSRESQQKIFGKSYRLNDSNSESTAQASEFFANQLSFDLFGTQTLFETESPYSTDIQNIVSACQNDPKHLFDIVRNNVRFMPYWGFRKGADHTWLTKSGNDADQAELLATLLRAAGYTAEYEFVWITMPLADGRKWFGAGNNAGLDNILRNADYAYWWDSFDDYLQVEVVAVLVTVDGITYRLIPSYKTFTEVAGVNLNDALGFNRANLLSAAGGTETATSVQGISDVGVTGLLGSYAMNLVTYIRTTTPNASLEEIIGGRRILHQETTNLAQTMPIGYEYESAVIYADPPAHHCDEITIAVGPFDGTTLYHSIIKTYQTREIAGRRIAVNFSANGNARLWLDDQLEATEPDPIAVGPIGCAVLYDHPYWEPDPQNPINRADQTKITTIRRDGAYTAMLNCGGLDDSTLLMRRREIVAQYKRQGLPATAPEMIAEGLNLLGLDWLRQDELGLNLIEEIAKCETVFHHKLGFVRQEDGFTVDVFGVIDPESRDGDQNKSDAALRTTTVLGSAMESGVIQQQYPGRNAVSTVQYVRRNNALSKKTYLATSANFATISADPDFAWSQSWKNKFSQFLAANSSNSLILPQDGEQTVDQLTGSGYLEIQPNSITAWIKGGGDPAMGGQTTEPGTVYPGSDPTPLNPTPGLPSQTNPQSAEPVDLFSGAYIFDRTDLRIGNGGARGLSFSRHYSSAASSKPSVMGAGWSHNYMASLATHTDINAALGRVSAENAASLVAAVFAICDLIQNSSGTAKGWTVATIASGWGLDVSLNNATTLSFGRKTLTFIRRPDGNYTAPAGVNATLAVEQTTGTFVLSERSGGKWAFDAQNHLASFTDSDGKMLIFTHDGASGKLLNVNDCYGRALSFVYYPVSEGGQLRTVSDSTGRVLSYTYTVAGELKGATDPEGNATQYEYDSNGRLWKVYNEANELVVENLYDARGCVYRQIAEGDAAQAWKFAFTGVLSTETNPAGNTTAYFFDHKGRQVGLENGERKRSTMIYDGQNHIIEIQDPRGNTTKFEYDDRNNLRFVTTGENHTSENVYDAYNHLEYTLDGAGKKIASFGYDAEHHITSVTDGRNRTKTLVYYPNGHSWDGLLWKVIENNNDTTLYSYDSNGNLSEITRPDGSVVELASNARGDLMHSRITTVGDPHHHEVFFSYDKRRLLLSARDALGFGIRNEYDGRGALIKRTDRTGRITNFSYSPQMHLMTTVSPSGAVTVHRHDSSGRCDNVTNALNHASNFAFDGANRIRTVTDARNQATQLGYDSAGNRNLLINTRNKVWAWTHNASNRVETMISPGSRVWNYGYDNRELLETVTEPSLQSTTFRYWDDRTLRSSTDSAGAINYEYDSRGRLDTTTEGTQVIDRDWDKLDRLERISDGAGNLIGYKYDGAGNLSELTYPDGKKVNYFYDAGDRLAYLIDWANRRVDFQYDSQSRLAAIVFQNGIKRRLAYDGSGRINMVIDEKVASGEVITQSAVFEYSALDQIKREMIAPTFAGSAVSPGLMTFDDDDRLVSYNGQTCANDADGNLISGPLSGSMATFVYDARNRLVSAGSSSYAYDAEGRRISKTEGGVTTTYVNDPNDSLSRLLVKTEGSAVTRYVYALGLLLYEETGSNAKTYHFDLRGSTVALTDDAGAVVGRVAYGAYGEVVFCTSGISTPFLYHGEWGVQTDANRLCYMRARYYSPELRRFMNMDPLGLSAGPNVFGFCGGNPITRKDPSGLYFGFDDGVFMAAGALVGVVGKFVGNVLTGNEHHVEDYIGAAVGGAVSGEVLLYTGNAYAAGAAGGAAGNITTQIANNISGRQEGFNVTSFVADTAIGAATGIFSGRPFISGVNSGQGSFLQVFRQVVTKAQNGTISSVSDSTLAKMAVGAFYEYGMVPGSVVGSILSNVFGNTFSGQAEVFQENTGFVPISLGGGQGSNFFK